MTDPHAAARQQALDGLREIMLAVEQSRHTIAARVEVNISDMSTLSYIRSRGALGQKDLADYLGFSTSSITTLIDRLEAKKLVQRTPTPTTAAARSSRSPTTAWT
jgi:DNA-binding MarR family transcriptional regulator